MFLETKFTDVLTELPGSPLAPETSNLSSIFPDFKHNELTSLRSLLKSDETTDPSLEEKLAIVHIFGNIISAVAENPNKLSEDSVQAYSYVVGKVEELLFADKVGFIPHFKFVFAEKNIFNFFQDETLLSLTFESNNTSFLIFRIAYILATVLSEDLLPVEEMKKGPEISEAIQSLTLNILSKSVKSDDSISLTIPVKKSVLILSILLRSATLRKRVTNDEATILLKIARESFLQNSLPTLYTALNCFWLICFSPKKAVKLATSDNIYILTLILRAEPLLKNVRLVIAILLQIIQATPEKLKEEAEELDKVENKETQHIQEYTLIVDGVVEDLLGAHLLKLLEVLQAKPVLLKDIELKEDLHKVIGFLKSKFHIFSTFERFERELKKGVLTPSTTLHTEAFFRENNRKFERKDFEAVKQLIKLLDAKDETTVSIACADIGYFVQFYPNGKSIVENLNGKKKIMLLLSHSSQDVQTHALTTCSKILIHNWRGVEN
eukprot:snap_masked-scaffold_9-processed-gene-1.12-mRNA-1 protein AED:0.38 eAED:0.38 QI:0/-1/0/1/-1/1/1/0/493